MANCGVLLIVLLNFLFVQAQNNAGNVLGKSSGPLPEEPPYLVSKAAALNCACSRIITFDDFVNKTNTNNDVISNGYAGFRWVNTYYLNTTYERVTVGWNGYATAKTSGIFVAFNGHGTPMSMSLPIGQTFQLNGLVLSAAWYNNLVVTIKGTASNVLRYQSVVILQVATKTTLTGLKWSGIDNVTFSSANGTLYPGLGGSGTQFAIDDIDVSV